MNPRELGSFQKAKILCEAIEAFPLGPKLAYEYFVSCTLKHGGAEPKRVMDLVRYRCALRKVPIR